MYLWSGFYVGANIGGGWASADHGFSGSGVVGGGQIGYNFQNGHWVWGAEADISGAGVNGNAMAGGRYGVDMASTLTGRLGYSVDRWLVYGKAGVGWVDVKSPLMGSDTATGGAFGVGAEYALGHNWSAKVEYDFIDVGSDAGLTGNTFQSVKAGVNYHFPVGFPIGKY